MLLVLQGQYHFGLALRPDAGVQLATNFNKIMLRAISIIASEAGKGLRPFAKPRSHAIERECI